MALTAVHNETTFGVGDTIRVLQKIKEGEKTRNFAFEGMVIGIKGSQENKSFIVRRIGTQKVGIEQIFPLNTPTIEKIEVKREGLRGVRQAKLYFTRDKSKREIEKIYSRAKRRHPVEKKVASVKKTSAKKSK